MSLPNLPSSFQTLLKYLDTNHPTGQESWNAFTIESIGGGANNLVYRVKDGEDDFAVKFTIKDGRNRARREFVALHKIQESGLEIAPRAIWLNEKNYSQPVVVQTWVPGQQFASPPENKSDWQKFIAHFCSIHSIKQKESSNQISAAVFNFRNGQHGKAYILTEAEKLPNNARPTNLNNLLKWFEAWEPPTFPNVRPALCRVDPNWRNFIMYENKCVSVDWENSGWGDPAFEIADLMSHPAYESVPSTDWDFVIQTYANLSNDPDCIIRIMTYYLEMQLWWVIRWARYLYEIPRGLDERLVKRPANWKLETEKKLSAAVEKFQAYVEDL